MYEPTLEDCITPSDSVSVEKDNYGYLGKDGGDGAAKESAEMGTQTDDGAGDEYVPEAQPEAVVYVAPQPPAVIGGQAPRRNQAAPAGGAPAVSGRAPRPAPVPVVLPDEAPEWK